MQCSPACGALQHCQTDGGCEEVFTGIELLEPTDGLLTSDQNIDVLAQLTPDQLVAAMPPTLGLGGVAPDGGVVNGTLTRTTGRQYAGTITAAAEGAWVVRASLPDAGLVSADTNFVVNRQAIAARIVPLVPDYGVNDATFFPIESDRPAAVRRDERFNVRVEFPDAGLVMASAVSLRVRNTDGGQLQFAAGSGMPTTTSCDAGLCVLFDVDLAQLPFDAMRGTVSLIVGGTSTLSTPLTGSRALDVTRWRWARKLPGSIKASPAVTSSGDVVVGYAGAPYGVQRVSSAGVAGWSNVFTNSAVVLGSPAIGRDSAMADTLFVPIAVGDGTIAAVSAATGASIGTVNSCTGGSVVGLGGTTPSFSPAVSDDGSASVSSYGVLRFDTAIFLTPKLSGFAPFQSGGCRTSAGTGGGTPIWPGNIAFADNTLLYPDENGHLNRSTASGGLPGSVSTFPSTNLGSFTGIALYGSAAVVAGTSGGLRGYDASGGNPTSVAGAAASAPVIGTSANGAVTFTAFGSPGGAVQLRKHLALGLAQQAALDWSDAQASATVAPSAVLGRNGRAYFVSSNDQLLVARQSDLGLAWKAPLSTSIALGAISAAPTLDCNRSRAGTQTGSLYIATETGYLVNIIVDSPGLDSTAPWPKYQHDAFNTGRLSPAPLFNPGCP